MTPTPDSPVSTVSMTARIRPGLWLSPREVRLLRGLVISHGYRRAVDAAGVPYWRNDTTDIVLGDAESAVLSHLFGSGK